MLTFDKIRDIERTERDGKKLQKLPDDFIQELRDYINRKESIKEKTLSDMNELERIRDSIRKIFEMRQKKILDNVFETTAGGAPAGSMTKDEQEVFSRLVDIMRGFRESLLHEVNKKDVQEPETKAEERQEIYKVLRDLPEFVGPDMKAYKLKKDEVINISKPLNEFLLKKGVIEKVE